MVRKKYQVFTPKNTVNDMLDYIGYTGPSIVGKRIIDLSCGDGAFLCLALKRLISECKNQHLPDKIILDICNRSIYGIEIDEKCHSECIKNLNAIIKNVFSKKCIKWKNVINSDGLNFSESGFDFVVGNPPYISYRDMSNQDRDNLREKFESCKSNRFDYSYAFVEKSLSILSDSGVGCIICPINMYKIKSGELIKNIMRPYLSTIVDVTEDNIFPNVLTNPVISVFDKKIKKDDVLLRKKKSKKRTLDRNNFENEIIGFRQSGAHRFGDFFSVHYGVATLLNEAFLVFDDKKIEKDLLKQARSPRFERYGIIANIVFPYIISSNKIKRIKEVDFSKKYPLAYNHLSNYKDKLLIRKSSAGVRWFEYGRTQALESAFVEKIMMPAIMSEGVKPVLLGKNDIVFAGLYVTSKDLINHPISEAYDILSNNMILYNYIKHAGIKMNGGSYRYGPEILENFRY